MVRLFWLSLSLLSSCVVVPSDDDASPADDDSSADDDPVSDDDSAGDDDDAVFIDTVVVIEPTWEVDLETGLPLDGANDLWWEMISEEGRALNLQGFTRAALIDGEGSRDECAAAGLSADSLDASGPDFGVIYPPASFCLRTGEGHLGVAHVRELVPRDNGQFALRLAYTLWEPAEVPPPVITDLGGVLDPWLFVDWHWASDFADRCALEWRATGAPDLLRTDGPVPPVQVLDDPQWDTWGFYGSLLPMWPESWGNSVDVSLRCTRDLTGLDAESTVTLVREAPTTPSPAISSFTGTGQLTGDPWAPHSLALAWTSENADVCILHWLDEWGGLSNSEWSLGPSESGSYVWEESWGAVANMTLVCRDTVTGRYDEESIAITLPN